MDAVQRNPHYRAVIGRYPDLDAASLPWRADADQWAEKELDMFVGSGGFIKPKAKKPAGDGGGPSPVGSQAGAAAQAVGVSPSSSPVASQSPSRVPHAASSSSFVPIVDVGLQDRESAFETPGFSLERRAITMPVRVHCEDTSPTGHVRLESLVAYAERIRSLSLQLFLGLSLADLKKMNLAILANEYVVEIVGPQCGVMEKLRIDTTPEFPGAPLFPWATEAHLESGELYMRGLFGLSLCSIAADGSYRGTQKEEYDRFVQHMRHWSNPKRKHFSETSLRFFNAYQESGEPFLPAGRRESKYVVRGADCDLYSVLFQARVTSMTESCHDRRDVYAMYVNIMTSVRPGDELAVDVLYNEDSALFLFSSAEGVRITAFAHYGQRRRAICREEIKCCSMPGHYSKLLKFCRSGEMPNACKDFDLRLL